MNVTILEGNLVREPESRDTRAGTVATFTVATDESYEKDGRKVERTEYVPCQAWRGMADKVCRYRKGQVVYVIGTVITQSWEKDGRKQYKTLVRARSITTIATPKASSSSPEPARQSRPAQRDFENSPSNDEDSSLPF